MAPSDITIAIPTYEDDPALLTRVLDAATGQAATPVLVVDMSQSDRVARVADGREGVEYVQFRESRNVSDSRNELARRAPTRYVLFLDSDALPEPGWADAMRAGLDEERVAIVGARVLPAWGRKPPALFDTATASDWLSMFDLGDEPIEVPRVMGTSYALDKERMGEEPFDVSLGRSPGVQIAHEEVELALEAGRRGWRCWYQPAAIVRHNVGGDRLSWRWMMRRAYTAGRESHLAPEDGLEPLPRRMSGRDHAFRALVAPAFLAGRVRGLGRR